MSGAKDFCRPWFLLTAYFQKIHRWALLIKCNVFRGFQTPYVDDSRFPVISNGGRVIPVYHRLLFTHINSAGSIHLQAGTSHLVAGFSDSITEMESAESLSTLLLSIESSLDWNWGLLGQQLVVVSVVTAEIVNDSKPFVGNVWLGGIGVLVVYRNLIVVQLELSYVLINRFDKTVVAEQIVGESDCTWN